MWKLLERLSTSTNRLRRNGSVLYAKENNMPNGFDINEDDYFTCDKYCVKIKNNFSSIKLVVGQGSYIRIEKIEDASTVKVR